MSILPVGVARDVDARYPQEPPFDPGERYPELAHLSGGHPPIAAERNDAYRLVRRAFAILGLDEEHAGTASWNPLKDIVPRTGIVLLKPNLVLENGPDPRSQLAITTQGSVIRAVIDYVRLAGGNEVEVVIGDVPLQGADFDAVVEQNGLRRTVEMLAARGDTRIRLLDLRRERAIVDDAGFITRMQELPGDPLGYVEVDLGARSSLEAFGDSNFERFAVSDYRTASTRAAHERGRHAYLVPKTVLTAGAIINIPKLKTHQKAGLTVALKNLVGINGDKSRIPHFRTATIKDVGDEYPPNRVWLRQLVASTSRMLQGRSRLAYRTARRLWRMSRRVLVRTGDGGARQGTGAATLVGGGAWYGNDTLWRALHDLNRIVIFADAAGNLTTVPQRRYLCVVDGVVAGEGDGPLRPIARREGVIMAGFDPLAVDLVSATYMGLDWHRIPLLREAVEVRPEWSQVKKTGLDPIEFLSDRPLHELWPVRPFTPAPGWIGHVELPAHNERASSAIEAKRSE